MRPLNEGRVMNHGRRIVVAAAIVAIVAGCSNIRGRLETPQPKDGTEKAWAGIARKDITPFPGYSMAGYSVAAKTARGVWSRLSATAVYVEGPDGSAVAWVACDLWAIAGGLSDRVAELIRERVPNLGRDRIIVAATHTHHGPGNHQSCKFWNLAATAHGGFDRELFDFLAQRIADAVVEAAETARPARLSFQQMPVWNVARNRSPGSFKLDPEAPRWNDIHWPGIPGQTGDLFPGPPAGDDPARIINPTLSTLVLEDGNGPFGVVAFFAVHPTATGMTTEVYSADLVGVARQFAETELAKTAGQRPLVALFNGAEGDVAAGTTNDVPRDRRLAVSLGRRLGRCIAHSAMHGEYIDESVRVAGGRRSIADRTFIDRGGQEHTTARGALVGAPALGGAADGRTVLHETGWLPGAKGRRRLSHGPKLFALDPLGIDPQLLEFVAGLELPESAYPRTWSAAVHRIGKVQFFTLPGEFTTVMGRRIGRQLERTLDGTVAVAMGLANDYLYYVTTPEEYEAQEYEGAATLYGPWSGPCIAHDLVELSASLAKEATPLASGPARYGYTAGTGLSPEPRDIGATPPFADDGLANLVQGSPSGAPVRTRPTYEWCDRVPTYPVTTEPGTIPHIRLERQRPDGVFEPMVSHGMPVDDAHGSVIVVLREADTPRVRWMTASAHGARVRWAAIWLDPPDVQPGQETTKYRFVATTLDGESAPSLPFALRPHERVIVGPANDRHHCDAPSPDLSKEKKKEPHPDILLVVPDVEIGIQRRWR